MASCSPTDSASLAGCCRLEAVVGVDERGQLVLPKELRVRAGIQAGDKLALVSYPDDAGGICCIAIVKAADVSSAVGSVIGPAITSTR